MVAIEFQAKLNLSIGQNIATGTYKTNVCLSVVSSVVEFKDSGS